jgi:hypothetical protein
MTAGTHLDDAIRLRLLRKASDADEPDQRRLLAALAHPSLEPARRDAHFATYLRTRQILTNRAAREQHDAAENEHALAACMLLFGEDDYWLAVANLTADLRDGLATRPGSTS